MVASQRTPSHLKAIVPWEGLTDSLRDALQHGGIPETRFLRGWLKGSLARGAGDYIVAEGPAMMDEAVRNPFPLENIEVPALVCASWSNHGLHSRGSFEGFTRISSRDKWLYTHGGPEWEAYYSPDALEWQKSFLDHFLKGENNGFERRPRVRLAVRRSKEDADIRGEESWPPDRVRCTPLFLDIEHGLLTPDAPPDEQSRHYDAETRAAVEFTLRFDRRTEVTGPMALTLWVAAEDADDLDLYVGVRKFDRDGHEVLFYGKDGIHDGVVALGWLRVSQRHLDPERSKPGRPFLSHDRSEKIRPGEVVAVEIEILPSSTLFEPGESLRLVIGGREIVEQLRFGHDDTVNHGAHVVYAGGVYPSHLLIPIC